MKNVSIIMMAILLCVMASCRKSTSPNTNNPPEIDIPGSEFNILLCDTQPGKDSTYRFYSEIGSSAEDGYITFTTRQFSGKEGLYPIVPDRVQMILTPYNSISLETDCDVNASSSDACIDIERTDTRHYQLVFRSEGSSIIRLWNGQGENVREIKIRLEAASTVKCEGFEFRLGGETFFLMEQDCEIRNADWKACRFGKFLPLAGRTDVWEKLREGDKGVELVEKVSDTGKGMLLEFVGTVPRNATPDNHLYMILDPISQSITSTSSNYDSGYPPFDIWNRARFDGYNWVPRGECDIDRNYAGSSFKSCNPADLRYRKVWIWNQNFYNGGIPYLIEHIAYSFHEGRKERIFWGSIWGEPQME